MRTRDQVNNDLKVKEWQQAEAARQDNDDRVYELGCEISNLYSELSEIEAHEKQTK